VQRKADVLRSILPVLFVFAVAVVLVLSVNAQTAQTSTLSPQGLDAVGRSLQSQHDEQALAGAPVSESVRRFHYELTIQVAEVYDDNISLAPNNTLHDFYTRIGAVLTLSFGDTTLREENFLEAFYEPDFLIFADHSNFDNVQHVAYLAGQYRFSRLTLGVAQKIQLAETGDSQLPGFTGTIVNGVNIDTGGRRHIDTYTTHLSATYELTGKTYLSSAGDYERIDYSGTLTDSQRISGNIFLNYQYSPKLVAGLGVTAGRDLLVEPNSDQTFEQANLRTSYNPTDKLTTSLSVGVEFRQFDTDSREFVSPIFDLNTTYTPFDGTSISIDASRGTENSAIMHDQDYNSTQVQLTAKQRLFQRVVVSLIAGYQNLDYFGGSTPGVGTRGDNYYFLEPSIDIRITNFWYAGAFFVYRQNSSNLSNFSFDDTQVGIRSALRF
jgi:hypothetical protein